MNIDTFSPNLAWSLPSTWGWRWNSYQHHHLCLCYRWAAIRDDLEAISSDSLYVVIDDNNNDMFSFYHSFNFFTNIHTTFLLVHNNPLSSRIHQMKHPMSMTTTGEKDMPTFTYILNW